MIYTLVYPVMDNTLVHIGPLAIRWYAVAYIAGLLLGWWYVRTLCRHTHPPVMTDRQTEDLLVWTTLGVILGGRLGYILFYNFQAYLEDPIQMLRIWKGGMSFHGGLLGVVIAIILFARSRKLSILRIGDMVSLAVPIGLFFGRLANFVNGELFGRIDPDADWAMVFPDGGPLPRHPSQLYEATLEGLVLFVILFLLWRFTTLSRRPGGLFGVFLTGYGLARIVAECYREPDPQLGFLLEGLTMGQLLSVPMVLVGLFLLGRALKRPALKITGPTP